MATVVGLPTLSQKGQNTIRELGIADSSYLQHVKYDSSTLQLTVTMKNGAQYIHWMVYPMVFDQMMQAPSKGKFYSEAIRGKHLSTKVISKSVGKPFEKAPKKREVSHAGKRPSN